MLAALTERLQEILFSSFTIFKFVEILISLKYNNLSLQRNVIVSSKYEL